MIQLYKKDSKDKLRTVIIRTEANKLIQEGGLLDGNLVRHTRECTPKNVGKSNETTGALQAIAELSSIVTKKLREGYFKTIEEASNNKVLLPMLAKTADLSTLVYPVFIQPKLDGMRMLAFGSHKISRKNKEIETMGHINTLDIGGHTLDGELYAHGLSFQENMKLIKKVTKDSVNVKYHVYDLPSATGGFASRYAQLSEVVKGNPNIEVVPTYVANNEEELLSRHLEFISQGFEGTIIRLDGIKYTFNKRSSQLLKLKDFIDETYEIINVVPSDKIPEQGKVVCRMSDGQIFTCGMKLSHEERVEILINKSEVIGKLAEVRFFEYTDGGLPRFPVYHGWRLDK